MVSYKLDKIDKFFIAFLSIFVTIVCVFQTFGYCAETVIEPEEINNLNALENSNAFTSTSGIGMKTFLARKGYRYKIELNIQFGATRLVVSSSSRPSLGVPYNILYFLQKAGDYYVYNAVDNDVYITISTTYPPEYVTITEEPMSNYTDSIGALVDNVGASQIWSIFEGWVPYIGIVVLAGFGFYWIFHTIKEVSNGKEKMF